jgi:hypothetical protein
MRNLILLAGAGLVVYYFWQKSKKCGCGQTAMTTLPVNTDHAIPPSSAPMPQAPAGVVSYNAKEVGGVFPAQTTISTAPEIQLGNATLQ